MDIKKSNISPEKFSGRRFFAVLSAILIVFSFAIPVSGAEIGSAAGGVTELIPGGMTFGVKFFAEGAIVLGTTGVETASGIVSPAKDAGLQAGDIIIRAGGMEFKSASELISLIAGSGGKPIAIAFLRDGNEQTVTVTPARDSESGEYRMGAFVRDSAAGIGTITYIDPETLDFGGLGHGIYDSETGKLMPLARGAVVDVKITEIIKSERNSPGQLHGSLGKSLRGELWDNSEEGVFGRFIKMPQNVNSAIPVAERGETKTGKAYILTALTGETPERYEIEIERIYEKSGSTKNFLIHVTDQQLLDQTGGIVQGMSGSPIIQDGKLIGAVTHVLINDPTRGYGIFIENMLNSAYDVGAQQTEYAPIAA